MLNTWEERVRKCWNIPRGKSEAVIQNRQYNGQREKNKTTNNGQQNSTEKTKY